LVEINRGAVFILKDFFDSKAGLFKADSLLKYNKVIEGRGILPSYFLFQYITLYFLYHETGHLVQRNQGSLDYEEFIEDEIKGKEIEERHIREHDADWFSANQIAFHLIQFVKQEAKENDKTKFYSDLISIAEWALAGIFMYYIDRNKGKEKIYYQETTHPHPAVRLCYIVTYLLEALARNVSEKINQNTLLTNALRISEALMMEGEINVVEKYSTALYQEIKNIDAYINKIRTDSETYPHLARKALDL